MSTRKQISRADKKGFDDFVMLICWTLWKQRNARVFNRADQVKTVAQLHRHIFNEIKEWKEAGMGVVGVLHRFVRE